MVRKPFQKVAYPEKTFSSYIQPSFFLNLANKAVLDFLAVPRSPSWEIAIIGFWGPMMLYKEFILCVSI